MTRTFSDRPPGWAIATRRELAGFRSEARKDRLVADVLDARDPFDDLDDVVPIIAIVDDATDDRRRPDDPEVAAEEGMPWVPPIDPPVVATPWDEDPVVAAGTGVSALDEAYDEDSPGTLLPDEGELNERIREALRADSATSRLADSLAIGVVGSTAIIRGTVDDIDDSDNIVAVVERVPGIEDVRDETVFPGL